MRKMTAPRGTHPGQVQLPQDEEDAASPRLGGKQERKLGVWDTDACLAACLDACPLAGLLDEIQSGRGKGREGVCRGKIDRGCRSGKQRNAGEKINGVVAGGERGTVI